MHTKAYVLAKPHIPELPHPHPTRNPSVTPLIKEQIEHNGPLSFADYMAMALYAPGCGYYAHGEIQVGRAGDFYTSVSVGPCFGQLLARYLLGQWLELNHPEHWRITECGAHDGRLACDILDALAQLNEAAYQSVEYAIPEPLHNLREAQTKTLEIHAARLVQIADASELEPMPGVIIGNELLDALPCELIEWRNAAWQLCCVSLEGDKLAWCFQAITDPELRAATQKIGGNFPDGYRTEVRTNYESLLRPLADSLSEGRMLWIDYGFERSEYYHPDRRQGTLRTFSHHHAGEDVLSRPGEFDISAHVDFTAVAEACTKLGGRPHPLISQGNWLTHRARDWLMAQEGNPDPKAMRQFQTLTHPGHLGRAFQVLEIEFD